MKKYILTPLCSALVIPGLGQILNRDLKKGVIILGLVTLLFVAGTVEFVLILSSLFHAPGVLPSDPDEILSRLQGRDVWTLILLLTAFGIVWLYAVIDSFREGLRQERKAEADSLCDPI
jgi:hypothetical protein